jgi:hypothetical protein
MPEQDPRGGWHVTPLRITAEATLVYRQARRPVVTRTNPAGALV